MQSEEEKKAIEYIQKRQNFMKSEPKCITDFEKHIDILLNLIKRQQKEIEELKEKNASLKKEIKLMKSININDNYISKDKIREHLKKFEEIEKEFIFIDNKSTAREINKALIEFSKRLLEE